MKIYVGTYKRYNAGSLKGAWVDLDQFSDYKSFLLHATKLHSDEHDPELMIQDVESDGHDWQAGFTGEDVGGYADYWTVKAEAEAEASASASGAMDPIATVARNEEKGGIEIRFFERPDQSIIDDLKNNRWRWSRFAGCWYTLYNDEALKYAERIAGGSVAPGVQKTSKKPEDVNINSKDVKEEFSRLLNEDGESARMVEYYTKRAAAVIRLTGGEIVHVVKPSIETKHCEGEDDGRGRSMADANAGCDYFKTKEGFIRSNLREFDREIIQYVGRRKDRHNYKRVVSRLHWRSDDKTKLCDFRIVETNYQTGSFDSRDCVIREANEEDVKRMRAAYAIVRADFKRRLYAYWKRFGASKLRTWTYWTEA